jgi:hypothetical protein
MITKLVTISTIKKSMAIAVVSLLVLCASERAVGQTTMAVGSMSGNIGDTLTIPITATNFNDVGAISLKLNYNPTVTKFIGTVGAPTGVAFVSSAAGTTITLGWFDGTGTTPINLGSGTVVKLRVVYYGGTGTFSFNAAQCEIASSAALTIPVVYSDGSLTQSSNTKPTFSSVSPIAKNELETVSFTVNATDPNTSAVLTYSAANMPAGASFNAATRTFTWVPALNTAGVYTVKFYVSDGLGNDSTNVTVTISKTNVKPTLSLISAIAKNETQTVSFVVNATDPNTGDVLTYSAGSLPAGASFNASTRTFSWVPALNTAGVYSVKFYVTDGSLKDSTVAVMTISKMNLAPVMMSRIPANQDSIQANLGYALTYKVVATDPNMDMLTYTWKLNNVTVKSGKDSTYSPAKFTVLGTQKIVCVFTDGALSDSTTWTFNVVAKATKVENMNSNIPTEYSLEQNYPNPFNPSTTIKFGLQTEAPVTLEVFNILGEKVRTLISGEQMSAAYHNVVWDGKNDEGSQVASGMYLYRIAADKYVATMKMMLMK